MSFVATLPPRSEQERQIIALAEGFGALLRSSQKFAVLEKELRSRLSLAREEVCFFISLFSFFLPRIPSRIA